MWANKTMCMTSIQTEAHAPQAVVDRCMDELVRPPCNLGSKCPAVCMLDFDFTYTANLMRFTSGPSFVVGLVASQAIHVLHLHPHHSLRSVESATGTRRTACSRRRTDACMVVTRDSVGRVVHVIGAPTFIIPFLPPFYLWTK